jgi:hypothetical protein
MSNSCSWLARLKGGGAEYFGSTSVRGDMAQAMLVGCRDKRMGEKRRRKKAVRYLKNRFVLTDGVETAMRNRRKYASRSWLNRVGTCDMLGGGYSQTV